MKAKVDSRVITVLVAVLVVVLIGWGVQAGQAGHQEFVENSEEWCAEQGGEMHGEIAGGGMSGLRCSLPSGKDVDMGEVAQRDYPTDPGGVPAYGTAEYDGVYSSYPVAFKIAAACLAVGFAVVVYFRAQGDGDA